MSILSVRNAIATHISNLVPDIVDVRSHGGDINLVELKRVSFRPPGAFVSVKSADGVEYQGGLVSNVRFCIHLVTKNQPHATRTDHGLYLLQEILKLVFGNDWGGGTKGKPESIRAIPVYNSSIDETGACVWEVVWDQLVLLSGDNPQEYGTLLEIGMDYNTQNPPDEIPEAHDEIVPL